MVDGPGVAKVENMAKEVVSFAYNGVMRRNDASFALFSVGEMDQRTMLFRLSAVLRNTLVMCGSLTSPCNFWYKTTWPEFEPSLPPGLQRSCDECAMPLWFPCSVLLRLIARRYATMRAINQRTLLEKR